jgi:galactose mutarotase-like enzyme
MQLTRISNNELTVDVAALGAEMQSLSTRDGRNWLWAGDAAYWTGRSPVLFPMVGRAPMDVVSFGENRYQMGQHGFARRSAFSLIEEWREHCTYRLEASEATRAMFPFEFRLDVTHRLEGRAVIVSAEVSNLGAGEMPYGIGFHPAFAWPLPGGEGQPHDVRLENGGEPDMFRLSGGLIQPRPQASPFAEGVLALNHADFADDAMIFPEGAGTRAVYGSASGPQVKFSWQNLPNFALWTKPGAGFICLEPWHGMAAEVGGSDALDQRPYTAFLAPGGVATYSFRAELID